MSGLRFVDPDGDVLPQSEAAGVASIVNNHREGAPGSRRTGAQYRTRH